MPRLPIIPHPLAAVGILVYFLAYGFGTLLHAVQPVPGTAGGVIDLFAAVVGVAGLPALAHPVFVPVALAINRVPKVARRAAGHFAVNGVEVVQLVVYRNGTILHNTGLGVIVHLATIRQGPGALDHGTGDRLKIVPLAVLAVLTFYHVAVGIIAHPFAAVGFLINVFIHGLGTALVGIQPVPGVAAGIVNFLAAACGALLHAVFVPVVLAVLAAPAGVVVVPCVLSIHNGNDVKKAAVHGGIIEILKDKITILAEVAEWSDEIDVERANEARLRAEKRLASHDSNLDMVRAETALKRSLARIKAVN